MSNFNLVTDARLGQAAYSSNNQSNTAVIDDCYLTHAQQTTDLHHEIFPD